MHASEERGEYCGMHPYSLDICVYVPSADVVCATKYSGRYPAVLGYYLSTTNMFMLYIIIYIQDFNTNI
jgi:hypothetical protein